MATRKRGTQRGKTTRKPARPQAKPAPTPEPPAETTALAVRAATPERAFAGRAKPLPPPPPLPTARRAIFVDVENSSRAEHVGRVLDHLAIDRRDRRVDLIAVGNWRVIGADSARLLARRGAQLVHSAPSTGVRDWSDLRIAVSAGVWLGSARPGDLVEIISDDRAFDAVGDVAAVLGVEYRRLSYRGLTGMAPPEEPAEQPAQASRESRGRRRRGRRWGRGGGRHDGRPRGQGGPPPAAPRPAEPARADTDAGAHTAPHDELVEVVRELAQRSSNGAVLIDTVARALKERGFSRPPGSPRLITRLRRIRELAVSRTGMITLSRAGAPAPVDDATVGDGSADDGATDDTVPVAELAELEPAEVGGPGNVAGEGEPRRGRRRRRRRRGRRGGGGGGAPAASPG